jgi:hypothetical protein
MKLKILWKGKWSTISRAAKRGNTSHANSAGEASKKISHALIFNRHDKQATIIGKKRAIEGSDSLVAGLMKKQRKATAHVWFVNSWFSGIRTLDL